MALHGGMELQDEIRKAGVVPAIAAEQDLTAKMRVVRITAKAGSDRVRDPGTEFTGGSTGKGDDQKAVDVFGPGIGVLRVHIFHQPLGQDAGLAAACTGRDQDTAAAAADGLKLSFCKIHYVSS